MVFLSFSGADRLQGKSAQKCGPRPSVPRNRRNSSRVRSECAGAGPLGPRGRGTAAAGRVDGARRARAQIPGVGKGLRVNIAPQTKRTLFFPCAAGVAPKVFRAHVRRRAQSTALTLRTGVGLRGLAWARCRCARCRWSASLKIKDFVRFKLHDLLSRHTAHLRRAQAMPAHVPVPACMLATSSCVATISNSGRLVALTRSETSTRVMGAALEMSI